MLTKEDGKDEMMRVTFSLPAEVRGETAYLVGDFNDWDENSHPMQRDETGRFVITLDLEKGREYHFRYLIDANEWHNDWQADRYVQNSFGGDDSVVST